MKQSCGFIGRNPLLHIACAATLVFAALFTSCQRRQDASRPSTTGDRDVFCLTTEFFPQLPPELGRMRYPLVRELGRQAVLIAARDGLGLSTRDQTLGESFPVGKDVQRGPFAVQVRAYNDGNCRVQLLPIAQGASEEPSEPPRLCTFAFQGDTYNMYTALAVELAAASRGVLIDALKDAGVTGTQVAMDPEGKLPEGTESLLEEMNFAAQYAAVRQIHAAIAEQGESPARLGGLVRGYANLAMLTRHHWNSAESVFAARALLYAELMITASGQDRLAFQHRAYARALVGLHGIALQELNRLPAPPNAALDAAADPVPAWTQVTTPFCRFDYDELMQLADQPGLRQLVPQLAFDMQAHYGNPGWVTEVGQASLRRCPSAYGIYAKMADEAPMLIQRQVVSGSAEAFGRQLPRSVARIVGLPEPAVDLVGDQLRPRNSLVSQLLDGTAKSAAFSPLPMNLARSLRENLDRSGDVGEPSWQTLAQMIAEEQFIEVANCLEVSQNAVEHSKQELVDLLGPLVKEHPFAPYIESFTLQRNRQTAELQALLSKIPVNDPRGRMHKLLGLWEAAADARGISYHNLGGEALWQRDYHLPAIGEALATVHNTWWKSPNMVGAFRRVVDDLKAISPHAPHILRVEINTTSDPSSEMLADWEERSQADPITLRQVGQLYADRSEFEPAIRCFERSYELSPHQDTAISLATAYRQVGKPEKWLPALERYLQVDDYALGHSIIHRHIAEDHIQRGEWAKAEPHALESAKTWSTMGLLTASRVYEGLGNWEESERWMREAVRSYPSYNGLRWYLWCRRTGRGNIEEAKHYADQYLKLPWVTTTESGAEFLFVREMLDDQYEEALARLQQTPSFATDPYWQTHVVLLARRLDRDDVYNDAKASLLKLTDEKFRTSDPALHKVIHLLFDDRDEKVLPDEVVAAADEQIVQFVPDARCNYQFFLGEVLALQGDEKRAEKFWREAVSAGPFDSHNATFAGQRLVAKHGTSRPDDAETVEDAENAANSL